MKTLLKYAIVASLVMLPLTTEALAGDSNRSYQRSKEALISIGPSGGACKPGLFGLLPSVDIDMADGCSNIPNTYLYKKEVTDIGGGKTVTKEVKELRDTYEEVASISADGTETLSVIITSGRSADTNVGVARHLSISDLTNIFGNADTASKLHKTMSHGLSAIRRSHQEPVDAPTPANQ